MSCPSKVTISGYIPITSNNPHAFNKETILTYLYGAAAIGDSKTLKSVFAIIHNTDDICDVDISWSLLIELAMRSGCKATVATILDSQSFSVAEINPEKQEKILSYALDQPDFHWEDLFLHNTSFNNAMCRPVFLQKVCEKDNFKLLTTLIMLKSVKEHANEHHLLKFAIQHGASNCVRVLMQTLDYVSETNLALYEVTQIFDLALKTETDDMIQVLIQNGHFKDQLQSYHWQKIFHHAAKLGNLELLLQSYQSVGTDSTLDEFRSWLQPAIELASANGHVNIVEYIYNKFPKERLAYCDFNVCLRIAGERKRASILQFLLNKASRFISKGSRIHVFECAIRHNNISIFSILFENDAKHVLNWSSAIIP